MPKKIISQIKAAELAGVQKQAISKLKDSPRYKVFFTTQNKVNASHPEWKSYLKENKAKQKNPDKYTGNPDDFQWGNFPPETIEQEKTYADIVQKKINIEDSVGLLIEKRIVIAAFGEIIKSIQSNFIDYDKRVSPLIAAKLGLPGTEKTIEKILGPEKKKSLENVVSDVSKVLDKL